ncbi:hypothetical protein PT974_08324 [Cladobotryum mycophilum]|uniref:LysM domain-containing protein n=1 Tax=Cladobotryum mycophilum TaxID=491253 RepID=A0ABR0SE01_9HYPO
MYRGSLPLYPHSSISRISPPSDNQHLQKNQRFATYCPYCQVSSAPTSLPQGLRDPPSYSFVPNSRSRTVGVSPPPPPPYEADTPTAPATGNNGTPPFELDEKSVIEDTLHFLNHEHDTIQSLCLRYGVPAEALRRRNNITSDHLLQGRKTILIPGEHYRGGSLSPRPVEGEDEELRRGKIRRFMNTCKVSDYDFALLYLEQSSYDLDAAIESYFDDEAWEREHPNDRAGRERRFKTRTLFWRGL